CTVDRTKIAKRGSFASAVAHYLPERQRLPVMLQSLLLLTQCAVGRTDVVECDGLSGAITHGTPKRQRLLVILQCLLCFAQVFVSPPQVIECGSRSLLLAQGSPERQRLSIAADCLAQGGRCCLIAEVLARHKCLLRSHPVSILLCRLAQRFNLDLI